MGKQKSRRTALTRARRTETARGKEAERGALATALLTLAATSDDPPLIFADEFVEILKEADEDDEQRAGEADQEEHGQQIHSGTG
jgi:hypothetical protein